MKEKSRKRPLQCSLEVSTRSSVKRTRPLTRRQPEIIDLISSDDEEEDKDKEEQTPTQASVQTNGQPEHDRKQAAASAIGTVKHPTKPPPCAPQMDADTTSTETKTSHITRHETSTDGVVLVEAYQSRVFDQVEYRASDFPLLMKLNSRSADGPSQRDTPESTACIGASSAPSIPTAQVTDASIDPRGQAGTSALEAEEPSVARKPSPRPTQMAPLNADQKLHRIEEPVSTVRDALPSSVRTQPLSRQASGQPDRQGSSEMCPIELSEDDESSPDLVADKQQVPVATPSPVAARGLPFQSRVFDTVEFDLKDFLAVRDGLQLARKSSASNITQPPSTTESGASTLSEPSTAAQVERPDGAESNIECTRTSSPANHLSNQQRTLATEVQQPSLPAVNALRAGDELSSQSKSALPTATSRISNPTETTASVKANVLTARKKSTANPSRTNGSLVQDASLGQKQPTTNKVTVPARQLSSPFPAMKVQKPSLGFCTPELLSFFDECIDEESSTASSSRDKVRAMLGLVVDLTRSDSENDDDEDESDEVQTRSEVSALVFTASSTSQPDAADIAGISSDDARRRRSRPPVHRETCVLCDEKRWVRTLIHCPDCLKYYHKKCAKEYGDDRVCWNCELTEMEKQNVMTMLETLRYSSEDEHRSDQDQPKATSSETGSEAQRHEATADTVEAPDHSRSYSSSVSGEDRSTSVHPSEDARSFPTSSKDPAIGESQVAVLNDTMTRSMHRWKKFLEISTSNLNSSFEEVTNRITSELETESGRLLYSRGFASKEEFEAAMNEVLDSYAEMQEQLDRENREKAKLTEASPSSSSQPHQPASAETPQQSVTATSAIDPTVHEPLQVPGSLEQPSTNRSSLAR